MHRRPRRTTSPPARWASAGSPTSSRPRRPARSRTATVELENAGAGTWREVPARLPLARRARQRDRLGRPPHAGRGVSSRASAPRSRPASARRCLPAATGSRSTSWSSTAAGSRRSATSCSQPTSTCVRATPATPSRTSRRSVEPARTGTSSSGPRTRRGYAAVGGAIESRERELRAYRPGGGRNPSFAEPLVCPSLLPPLEPNCEVAGLPAWHPEGDEPWIYDGRIRARRRSGRRPA